MNIRYPASESEKGQIIASIDVFLWYTERMADTASHMRDSIAVSESVGDIDAALAESSRSEPRYDERAESAPNHMFTERNGR